MKNLISQEHELHPVQDVSFEKDSGHLVAQLDKRAFGLEAEGVLYRGKHFQPKDELHITILSSGAAEKVKQHLERHPQDEDRIRRLINSAGWSYKKIGRFYHIQAEPGVESLIQMVELPGLEQFFHELRSIVGADLPLPPTHVTLYTRGDPHGIGLPTRPVFEQRVQAEVTPDDWKPQESG